MRLVDRNTSRAVLIGASAFTDPALPDLPAVRNNLDDLESLLTDQFRTGLPSENCTVLRDPHDPDALGETLEAAAAQAQDMLLFYYAGHGLLDRNNELCLSLPHSRHKRARLSAIPFSYVREVLRDSPAANRIAILDCCFSGRAINDAMSDTGSVISGQVDVAGTYTLTSTPANTPALAPQGSRWTAFTGELVRVLRDGVAEPTEWLTLDLIYRHLHGALTNQGLPRPEQRGTRTAGLVALTRNPRWDRHHGSPTPRTTRSSTKPGPVSPSGAGAGFPNNDLFGLLGWNTAADFDPAAAWLPRPAAELLRAPLGVTENGHPVELDIKSATSGGYGPHGLCVGTVGSGKAELLRTIVLAFLMTHGPDQLNVMLVDWRDGPALKVFESAPHVSASFTVDAMHADLSSIERIDDALYGEVQRRVDVLGQTRTKDIWEYNQMRNSGKDLSPLPAFLVVVDNFTRMTEAKPEFADHLRVICRVARSVGVHFLMASHRLHRDALRNLEPHFSYRLGLRTVNSAESNAVLGIPDAGDLPFGGGHGYLKRFRDSAPERFRASYVSRQANLSGEFNGMTELEVAVHRMANHNT